MSQDFASKVIAAAASAYGVTQTDLISGGYRERRLAVADVGAPEGVWTREMKAAAMKDAMKVSSYNRLRTSANICMPAATPPSQIRNQNIWPIKGL